MGLPAGQRALPCVQEVNGLAPGALLRRGFEVSLAPNSPDLHPMDYFFWGYLEQHTNRAPHTTKESLITSIMEEARLKRVLV